MIEGKNFKIFEFQDIVDACNHIEGIAGEILKKVDASDPECPPEMSYKLVDDMFTVIGAAGVGAAVCKQQGGLVLMKEGFTKEDEKEAVQALEKLRPKPQRPVLQFNPGGAPQ